MAPRVASPPYDVVTRTEAALIAEGNPQSFLHVGRSDIDLPPDVSPYADAVYASAREALRRFQNDGTLVQDPVPSLYLYALDMRGRTQVGLVGCLHVDDYETDVIRKHERTRPDKEDDRTRHVLTLRAHAEPIFLAYRDDPRLNALAKDAMAAPPDVDFTSRDDVRHRVWRIDQPAPFVEAFAGVPFAYVADGHHRTASAWRAGKELRAANPDHTGDEPYNWFLSVLFPASQLQILPYNRTVRDLGEHSPASFLAALAAVGRVASVTGAPAPTPGTFALYLSGAWHTVVLDPATIDGSDPIASLDAAILQDRVFAPLLGIVDQRTDPRLDFVGGIRGTEELVRRVDTGEAALAVALAPVTMAQLLAVSDAGAIMPPKSTWFEPKLKSGLFVHPLD